jgi:hypothetical protein
VAGASSSDEAAKTAALDLANRAGNREAITLLKSYGATPNAK